MSRKRMKPRSKKNRASEGLRPEYWEGLEKAFDEAPEVEDDPEEASTVSEWDNVT